MSNEEERIDQNNHAWWNSEPGETDIEEKVCLETKKGWKSEWYSGQDKRRQCLKEFTAARLKGVA